jgi:hypothetical protein
MSRTAKVWAERSDDNAHRPSLDPPVGPACEFRSVRATCGPSLLTRILFRRQALPCAPIIDPALAIRRHGKRPAGRPMRRRHPDPFPPSFPRGLLPVSIYEIREESAGW